MGTTGHLVPLPPLLPTFVTLSTLSTPRPHSATLPGYHLMRTSRATVWVAPLSVLRSLIPLLQPLLTPPMRPMGKSPRLVVLGSTTNSVRRTGTLLRRATCQSRRIFLVPGTLLALARTKHKLLPLTTQQVLLALNLTNLWVLLLALRALPRRVPQTLNMLSLRLPVARTRTPAQTTRRSRPLDALTLVLPSWKPKSIQLWLQCLWVGPRRQPQPGNTWSSSPVTPRGTLVSQKNTNTLAQNLGLYHVGGGLLGPLPALPPGLPPPTVIRCLRTVATNQLPQPQLAGTLPRP